MLLSQVTKPISSSVGKKLPVDDEAGPSAAPKRALIQSDDGNAKKKPKTAAAPSAAPSAPVKPVKAARQETRVAPSGPRLISDLPHADADKVRPDFEAHDALFQEIEVAGRTAISDRGDRYRASCFTGLTELGVSTITFDVSMGLKNGNTSYIGVHLIKEILASEKVIRYNEDTLGRQPELSEKLFNGNPFLKLNKVCDDDSNNISFMLSENLSVLVAGSRSLAQFKGLAEYCRGFYQAIREEEVVLHDFKCNMINSNFKIETNNSDDPIIDREALRDRLKGPAIDVKLDDKHAGVRYILMTKSVSSGDYPKIMVFRNGKVTIQAKNFRLLDEAHGHVLGELAALLGRTAPADDDSE